MIAAETAYYQEMAKFVDPGITAYVVLNYSIGDEISGLPCEGVFSSLELAQDAARRSKVWRNEILMIEVDDMSGPAWLNCAVVDE